MDMTYEMSCPLNGKQTYMLASECDCRNCCIVLAAILKAMEVAAGIFLSGGFSIKFVERAI